MRFAASASVAVTASDVMTIIMATKNFFMIPPEKVCAVRGGHSSRV
ncbi:hypothetical protein IMCC9480_452 [Oxalobacteraceae bacterium IMCC9480]|nr:hypothetical protein IMCC9480_452 [Oxalobacteraceae bacterium IMCC9480]